jgi:heme A synthase
MGFSVTIHFVHRAMAAVLAFALPGLSVLVLRDRGSNLAMRAVASLLVTLLSLQIFSAPRSSGPSAPPP